MEVPSYDEREGDKLDEPLYNASLMRLADMATFYQLVIWKFEQSEDFNGDKDL